MSCFTNRVSSNVNYSCGEDAAEMTEAELSKALKMAKIYIDEGFTKYQAAAIAGTCRQESGYNPNSKNSDTAAYGLFQWLPQYQGEILSCGGYPSGTKLSSLTFEQQAKLFIPWLSCKNLTGGVDVKAILKSTGNILDAFCVVGSFVTNPGPVLLKHQRIPTRKETETALGKAAYGKAAWDLYYPYCLQVLCHL